MDTVIVADWLSARLDRSSPEPMYRQLLQLMQQAILTGELGPGTKLPSSRTLAGDLSIARNTVLHVYDQLTAEGYVLTTTGSGTYVADTRPDTAAIHVPGTAATPSAAGDLPLPDAQGSLSMRGRQLIEHAGVSRRQWGAFMPGVPDVSEFPSRTWSRLQARLWKEANPELLTYAPGGGYRPLRRALADYLRVARSVKCSPDQVIITTGIHQSIDLAVRLLSDIGDRAWVEEPCYWGVRSVLQAAGLTLAPVPVDQEGLDPRANDMQHPPRL
ncbi:PLP-dependent aminotransferase family protein, partial [Burkholderia sp.]